MAGSESCPLVLDGMLISSSATRDVHSKLATDAARLMPDLLSTGNADIRLSYGVAVGDIVPLEVIVSLGHIPQTDATGKT